MNRIVSIVCLGALLSTPAFALSLRCSGEKARVAVYKDERILSYNIYRRGAHSGKPLNWGDAQILRQLRNTPGAVTYVANSLGMSLTFDPVHGSYFNDGNDLYAVECEKQREPSYEISRGGVDEL